MRGKIVLSFVVVALSVAIIKGQPPIPPNFEACRSEQNIDIKDVPSKISCIMGCAGKKDGWVSSLLFSFQDFQVIRSSNLWNWQIIVFPVRMWFAYHDFPIRWEQVLSFFSSLKVVLQLFTTTSTSTSLVESTKCNLQSTKGKNTTNCQFHKLILLVYSKAQFCHFPFESLHVFWHY